MSKTGQREITGKGCMTALGVISPLLLFIAAYSIDAGCFMCLDSSVGAFGLDHSEAQYVLNVASIIIALVTSAWLAYLIRSRW